MRALFWGLAAFAAAVLIQLLVWRLRRPRGQYATLVGISMATLAVGLAVAAGLGLLRSTLEYWDFVAFYAALILAYVTTYSAVQADSPTMVILLRLESAGSRGLTGEDLFRELSDEALVAPRVADLVSGSLAAIHDGRYVIARPGRLMARIHTRYRRLLGMEKGG